MAAVDIARVYLEKLKYYIFPVRRVIDAGAENARCSCSDIGCPNAGKHPHVAWSKEIGTVDMWERWPEDGFGIATGTRSGIWVLDVDTRKGGDRTLKGLIHRNTPLPDTITVRTGSGGEHYYFQYPGPEYRNTAGALGDGLDTRGNGGFVVGPGSMHKSGRLYTWKRSPADAPLAVAPEWLLSVVKVPPFHQNEGPCSDIYKPGFHPRIISAEEREKLIRCIFVTPTTVWMYRNPNEVKREVWRAYATNIACAPGKHKDLIELARSGFHELSARYDRYRRDETERVFQDSLKVAETHGPISFEYMVRSGLPEKCVVPRVAKNLLHSAMLITRGRIW